MQGTRMDDGPSHNRIIIVGRLPVLPVARTMPPDGRVVCDAPLAIAGGAITVLWDGEEARRMGAIGEVGTCVLVDGQLVAQTWKTRKGESRERIVLKSETTKILSHPCNLEDRP